jgi:ribosomal protein L22
LAKTLVLTLGLEPVEGAKVDGTSAWAAGYVQAALDAKLIDSVTDFKVPAKRALLVEATYEYVQAQNPAVLKVSKASQTGAKKITLEFNKPVTKDLAIEAKYLSTSVALKSKTFADDLKSVVLEAGYLPAGDIVIKAGDAEAVTVKVEAEKAAKVSITTESLQVAANQDLGIKKFNQFNEETSVGQAVYTNVYNSTKGKDLKAVLASGKLDLSNADNAKVDDVVIVSVYTNDGLSDTKSFKLTAASSATKIEFSAVAPLKDKTRITVGEEGLVLPVKFADQYGKSVTLATYNTQVVNGQFNLSGITFLVGGDGAISNIKVDDKGVITFKAEKAGNVIISASNPATGAYASTSFKIEGAAVLKELKLSNPAAMVVQGEDVVIPFTAIDTFGGAIAGKDLNIAQANIMSTVGFTYKINAKGELVFNFTGKGNATVNAVVNGLITSTVSLEVLEASTVKSVQGLKDVTTTLESGASVDIAAKNIQVVDNYGRVKTVDQIAGANFSIAATGDFTYANGKLTATAGKVSTGELEITYSDANVTGVKSAKIAIASVKSDDIKSFEIKSVGTLYANDKNVAGGAYTKAVELNGKTAGGTVVALVSAAPSFVSSSDESIVKVDTVTKSVYALKAGKATVAAYLNGNKVAEAEVTTSDAAPVATTVKLDKDEYAVAIGGTVTVSVEVKDQYGVVISPAGLLAVKEGKDFATVNGLVVTGVKKGTATVSYVTSNGTSATATIVVE